MDLRLLRYFVAVVDHGGITRAASALYIAQPSLSQAMRKLEDEVGAELFDRSGRPLTLTAAGRTFEVGARAALREADEARRAVTDVRELRAGRLRIATTPFPALDPLPQVAALLRDRHPQVNLHVRRPGSSGDVVGEVRAGRAEVGLLHLDVDTASLERIELGRQEFGLVLAEEAARGLPDPFPLHRLPEIDLVSDEGDGAGPTEDVIGAHGGRVVVWSAHPQTTWDLVRLGVGATILPVQVGHTRIPGARVLATDPPVTRPLGAVHRAGLSPAAEHFVTLLRSVSGDPERPAGLG